MFWALTAGLLRTPRNSYAGPRLQPLSRPTILSATESLSLRLRSLRTRARLAQSPRQFKDASPSRSGKLWWEGNNPSNPSAVSDGKNPAGNAKLRDWTPSRVVGAEPYAAVNLNKITIPAGTQLEIQQIGYNAIGTGCQILWTHSSDVAADGTVFVLQLTAKPDIATRIPHGSQRPISGVGLFRTGQSTKP